MKIFSSYLVCGEHLGDVRKFLDQFFEEVSDNYCHSEWITFKIPNIDFTVSLMKGDEEKITQNMTFEIDCELMEELEGYAQKHNCKIKNFESNKANQKYIYHYIETQGPENICKMEISFSEDIN